MSPLNRARPAPRSTVLPGRGPRRLASTATAVTLAVLVLGGCAGGLPFAPSASSASSAAPAAPDTSPAAPTAVHVVALTSDGLAGFFPFEGTSSSYTRADMRREESTVKGTGTVSRFLMPNTATANITRLDRKLVYALDIPRAEYTECPLGGCAKPTAPEPTREREPPASSARERDCTMKVASNTFNVKPTSQRRAINGFDTEQYAVDWSVVLEDPSKRRSTLQLTVDLWTTPVTPAIREAMALEASFGRAALAATDRNGVLPAEFITMMNRYFSSSLSASDRAALFNVARQMERIKGQPILTQLKLFYKGEACGGAAAEEGESSGGGRPSVAGMLSNLLGGGGASGGSSSAAGAERPLLSFSQEVKAWRVEPVRESQFAPPPQFKRTNPR